MNNRSVGGPFRKKLSRRQPGAGGSRLIVELHNGVTRYPQQLRFGALAPVANLLQQLWSDNTIAALTRSSIPWERGLVASKHGPADASLRRC